MEIRLSKSVTHYRPLGRINVETWKSHSDQHWDTEEAPGAYTLLIQEDKLCYLGHLWN